MPHPLFLFEARRASKGSVSPAGSVGAPATPGRPQDDRALSWTFGPYLSDKPVGLRMVRSRLPARSALRLRRVVHRTTAPSRRR